MTISGTGRRNGWASASRTDVSRMRRRESRFPAAQSRYTFPNTRSKGFRWFSDFPTMGCNLRSRSAFRRLTWTRHAGPPKMRAAPARVAFVGPLTERERPATTRTRSSADMHTACTRSAPLRYVRRPTTQFFGKTLKTRILTRFFMKH